MPAEINEPVKVFYSYARKDKDFRDELDKHLSPIKLQYHITSWSDRKIRPGTEWEQEIGTQLETAHLICLLISADFMHSDSCRDEMERALVRHRAGYARVIPIIVRPVYWKGAPFSMLQVLPTDAKPISQWSDPDDAYVNIAKYICEEVEELIRLLKSKEGTNTAKLSEDSDRVSTRTFGQTSTLGGAEEQPPVRVLTAPSFSSESPSLPSKSSTSLMPSPDTQELPPVQESSEMLEAREKHTTIPHQPTERLTSISTNMSATPSVRHTNLHSNGQISRRRASVVEIEIFLCYASEDETGKERLARHLGGMQRQGIFRYYTYEISEKVPSQELETAQIVVLFVSPHFVNSEFCHNIEFTRAIEQRNSRPETPVMPVVFRPVHWAGTCFGKLKSLPMSGRPIMEHHNRDIAFYNVAEGIRKAAIDIKSSLLFEE